MKNKNQVASRDNRSSCSKLALLAFATFLASCGSDPAPPLKTKAPPPAAPVAGAPPAEDTGRSGGSDNGGGDTAPPPPSVSLTQIRTATISTKCLRCHNEFVSYEGLLGAVQPGNAAASALFIRVNNGTMPRGGPKLPQAEIDAIASWINAGAKDD